MRALYIISIILTFFFIFIMAAGTIGTKEERNRYYDRVYSSDYSYDSYEYGDPDYVTSTYIAVGISMAYFAWAYLVFICSLAIVKTKTSKVISIIAISLTTLMLAWGILAMAEPRSLSFDEIGGAWIFYGFVMLVFSIVGTVQAFRYHSQKNNPQPLPGQFQQAYANPFLQPQYRQPNPYQQQQNPYGQPYYPPFPQQQQNPYQQNPPYNPPQQNPYQQNPPYNPPQNPYQQNPPYNQPPQPPQPPQPNSNQDPNAPQPPADSPRNPWAPPQ